MLENLVGQGVLEPAFRIKQGANGFKLLFLAGKSAGTGRLEESPFPVLAPVGAGAEPVDQDGDESVQVAVQLLARRPLDSLWVVGNEFEHHRGLGSAREVIGGERCAVV